MFACFGSQFILFSKVYIYIPVMAEWSQNIKLVMRQNDFDCVSEDLVKLFNIYLRLIDNYGRLSEPFSRGLMYPIGIVLAITGHMAIFAFAILCFSEGKVEMINVDYFNMCAIGFVYGAIAIYTYVHAQKIINSTWKCLKINYSKDQYTDVPTYFMVLNTLNKFNNNLVNNLFLYRYTFTMIHVVLNIYIGIVNFLDYQNIWQSRYILVHFLGVAQTISKSSDEVISLLYRFPISKLTPTEAAQVEILLTTLQSQKPILKASDIFVIGTKLIVSILGTIFTYVLVALQFHASRLKS